MTLFNMPGAFDQVSWRTAILLKLPKNLSKSFERVESWTSQRQTSVHCERYLPFLSCDYSTIHNRTMDMDANEDVEMMSGTHQSQFTQSLMLFVSLISRWPHSTLNQFLFCFVFEIVSNPVRNTVYSASHPVLRQPRTFAPYTADYRILGGCPGTMPASPGGKERTR